MDGYLLDTCILDYWHDAKTDQHHSVVARIAALPPKTPMKMSVVTLGEIEYGHLANSKGDKAKQASFNQFVAERFPPAMEITQHTVTYYGELRARLFEKFSPGNNRKKLRPEQLVNPITARELGIQENDVWIAAQAMEHRLVLVTADHMHRIREVVQDLLQIEDWTLKTASR